MTRQEQMHVSKNRGRSIHRKEQLGNGRNTRRWVRTIRGGSGEYEGYAMSLLCLLRMRHKDRRNEMAVIKL